MNLKLLEVLEKNGNLKLATFLNENKDYIVSLILRDLTYKEIVTMLNDRAVELGLKSIKVGLNSFVSWLNRKNLTKDIILKEYPNKGLKDDVDELVKDKAVEDTKVEVFKNLVK